MPRAKQRIATIHGWNEVPAFESEAEESAFWATHDLSDELLAEMKPAADTNLPPPRPRTRPIAIRFDESTLHRIKTLAARRGKGYRDSPEGVRVRAPVRRGETRGARRPMTQGSTASGDGEKPLLKAHRLGTESSPRKRPSRARGGYGVDPPECDAPDSAAEDAASGTT